VTIHSQSKEVTHSGQYWALAHFSRAIRPGPHRFASTSTSSNLSHGACENPDGKRVLVLSNRGLARIVELRAGNMAAAVPLESDSVNTLTWES
jgi:glucosylceramidase